MSSHSPVVVPGADDHRLRPLLSPRSIALVGASPRSGAVGNAMMDAVLSGGFAGPVHLVNPRYDDIGGRPCVARLADLDTPPELVVLNVGAARMEAALADTIAAQARAAVVFDACRGEAAAGGPLLARLRDMAREAGLPVCGGNGMGFFNVTERCHASFYNASHLKPGGITLVAHSGSVFTVLALNDPRYRFDLVVSSGQEIGAGIDEYVDYALARPQTRVIAVFMETARNPAAFVAALERAAAAGVPVVVCKVGRTEESARLAVSHSGALAGSDTAYEAVLERTGAVRVDTVDQLMNAALLLAQGRVADAGELACVTDSGGLRELLVDRAHQRGVPLAVLSETTRARLAGALPDALLPSNPLDCAAALDTGFEQPFRDGLEAFAAAPEAGIIGYEFDARDDHVYHPPLLDLARELPSLTAKPCFAYTSFVQTGNRQLADSFADAGLPLLNGLDEMLGAVDALRRWRDGRARRQPDDRPPAVDPSVVERWRTRLAGDTPFDEAEGLALLADFGIATARSRRCRDWPSVAAAAREVGFPLVLKTAAPTIAHKSDVGGVRAGIDDLEALRAAWRDIADRLGPQVLVQAMAPPGIELALGAVVDPDFGPLAMVSAGGVLIETLADRRFALAPFGPRAARHLLDRLAVRPLLDGLRGAPACDVGAAAEALARFSVLCSVLADRLAEMDVNPLIVHPRGAVAVDALVVPR